jgi:hypothetical protein
LSIQRDIQAKPEQKSKKKILVNRYRTTVDERGIDNKLTRGNKVAGVPLPCCQSLGRLE